MGSTVTDRISGLSTSVAVKAPVEATTTGNIALSGLGVQANGTWAASLTAGDRILVKDQTDKKENGIYTAFASEWRRAKDFDGYRDAVKGTTVSLADSGDRYRVTTENPVNIGVSEIEFAPHPDDFRTIYVGSVAELSTIPDPTDGQAAIVTGLTGIFVYDSGLEVWSRKPEYYNNSTSGLSAVNQQEAIDELSAAQSKDATIQQSSGDLLEKLLSSAQVRGMYVRPTGGGVSVGVGMNKELDSVVEYNFVYDDDNMLLLRGVYSGKEDDTKQSVEPTLSGTFNSGSAPATYTSNPGDSFSFSFTGSELYFQHPEDDRGGLWKFTLSNGWTRNISTWSSGTAPSSDIVRDLVFDNLPHGEYQCVAEFLGDDPINAPSGGAGTARGWITYQAGNANQRAIHTSSVKQINESTRLPIVSQNSIPDFAILAKPEGAIYGAEWVPEHGGVAGVASSLIYRLQVDGDSITTNPGDLSSLSEFRLCHDVKIQHKFSATNPNGSDGEMWAHTITHSISLARPWLNIKNRIVVSQNTEVSVGYFGMLPSDSGNVSRLLLNDETEFSPVPADGSESSFGVGVTSAIFAGQFSLSPSNYHAAAGRVSSIREAGSLGRDIEPEEIGRITFRADGVTKVYWTFAENVTLLSGKVYTCSHDILGVSGIRSPELDMRSI